MTRVALFAPILGQSNAACHKLFVWPHKHVLGNSTWRWPTACFSSFVWVDLFPTWGNSWPYVSAMNAPVLLVRGRTTVPVQLPVPVPVCALFKLRGRLRLPTACTSLCLSTHCFFDIMNSVYPLPSTEIPSTHCCTKVYYILSTHGHPRGAAAAVGRQN